MEREKFFKKGLKHLFFFSIAFFISNIFLSYIIGIDELLQIISEPPSRHLAGFTAITIFSLVFYWVFSSFREQVCTMVCPYGRLQGVMLDKNSTVIAYDYIRGEPRGKIKKNNSENNLGDCIDCFLCVHVCPTGIDIRNGTQLECVNCTACIDECDRVMEKVNRPKGLIRYASENNIETGQKSIFTPRAVGYSFVLVFLIGLLIFLLGNRSNFELSILRTPGLMFQEQPDGRISNLYDLKVINKTFDEFEVELSLRNLEGEIKVVGEKLIVEPQGSAETKFLVYLDRSLINTLNTPIEIAAVSNGTVVDVVNTSFLGKVKSGQQK